jgi:hypothetical protein
MQARYARTTAKKSIAFVLKMDCIVDREVFQKLCTLR